MKSPIFEIEHDYLAATVPVLPDERQNLCPQCFRYHQFPLFQQLIQYR